MNNRMKAILKSLMGAEGPASSEDLATAIQVTSRTIRNDIKMLNEELTKNGALIVSLKGKGYELKVKEEKSFKHFLKEMIDEGLPDEPENRVRYLIRILLVQEDYIKMDDIADQLFVSRSTLQNDLRDVKLALSKYGLTLEKKPNFGFKVVGKEVKIRFCMSEHLFERKNDFVEMNESFSILPIKEMLVIKENILKNIKKYNISLSDISLNNLLVHIAIAYTRVKDSNYVYMDEVEMEDIMDQKEFIIASEMLLKVEQKLHVRFSKNEIAYVAMHLLGTRLLITPSIDTDRLNKFIDQSIFQLADRIVESVERKLNLGIDTDKELLAGLALHLKPAMNRYKYSMNLRNPMLSAIKTNYPLAFEAAVIAGTTIEHELNIQLDENELGYLALHFGAAIEKRTLHTNPKKCLIVCATGVGSSQLLYYKLRSQFETELKIVGTSAFHNLTEETLAGIDLLISTIDLPTDIGVPFIKVSTILGGSDIEKIRNHMTKVNDSFNKFVKKKYIYLQKDFLKKEDIIYFLCEQLIKDQLVDKNYTELVLRREKAAPTSFGNLVAIPHPLTPCTDKTFWMICTLKKPIDWSGKQVQFVCLLNIGKNNTEELKPMYEKLVSITDNLHTVKQLVKCKTSSQLLQVINHK